MKIIDKKLYPFLKSLFHRIDQGIYIVPLAKNSDGLNNVPNVEQNESRNNSWTVLNDQQFIFTALNNGIWILGVIVTLITIWLKTDFIFWNLMNLDVERFCAVDYIGIGATIFIIGLTGSYIANDKNTSVFKMFFLLMVILITLEMTAVGVLWSVIHDNQFQNKLSIKMKSAVKHQDAHFNYFMSAFQFKYDCCGALGAEEYETVPLSCVDFDMGTVHQRGCLDLGAQYIKTRAYILGGAFIVTLFLQILASISTLSIIVNLKKRKQQNIYFSEAAIDNVKTSML